MDDFEEVQPIPFYQKLGYKYLLSLVVGILLGMTVFTHAYLSEILAQEFGLILSNPYPKITYFVLFISAAPAATFLSNYFSFLPELVFDEVLKIGTVTNISYLLPPITVVNFVSNEKELELGPTIAIIGFGIVICFATAAIQAALIEKLLNKK